MLKCMTVAAAAVATTAALAGVPAASAHSSARHARGRASDHHRFHGRVGHDHRRNDRNCFGGGGTGPGNHPDRGCPPGTYSSWDEEWLKTSLEGDLFEIAGGKIAQSNASASEVKALGSKLMSDHTKSYEGGAKLAKQLGIEVPDEPTPSEQWELKTVSSFNGTSFDQAYTSLEVKDHEQDISEAKAEVEKGCNPLVRKDAAEELPTLEEHLKLSEAAEKQAGGQQQSSHR